MRYRKRGSRKPEDRIQAVEWRGFNFGQWPKGSDGKPCFPDWMPPLTGQVYDAQGTYDDLDMEQPDPGDAWKLGDAGVIRICVAQGICHDAGVGDFIIRYPSGKLGTMPRERFKQTYRAV